MTRKKNRYRKNRAASDAQKALDTRLNTEVNTRLNTHVRRPEAKEPDIAAVSARKGSGLLPPRGNNSVGGETRPLPLSEGQVVYLRLLRSA